MTVATQLIGNWLRARSICHGLPAPVPDRGGWRLDTARPGELRRHVFGAPCDGLRELGATVEMPQVFLKLCGSGAELLALLPPRWRLDEPRYVMVAGDWPAAVALAPGYTLRLTRAGAVTTVRIMSADGAVAATGHAAEWAGVFVYDRIETAPAHRRRGLGAGVMHALRQARLDRAAVEILVATKAGQALYRSLGWDTISDYSTAFVAV
ncbi:GNAT family N-acetyltransferase [Pseudoduganella chitinolytica]|uniref:GNAT family N-acetyltransferase n=1 Tax=Pseudoduganella chitinolytica TaxID=34070 RepID=A0ABY8B957_9BURK|nr:GNAT family N-acetyltransferase [Pseudoduganella chitinolytica]WEF30894.1 GNAT family N-acetyltransferase [Pseudoduganella chitinolytica]